MKSIRLVNKPNRNNPDLRTNDYLLVATLDKKEKEIQEVFAKAESVGTEYIVPMYRDKKGKIVTHTWDLEGMYSLKVRLDGATISDVEMGVLLKELLNSLEYIADVPSQYVDFDIDRVFITRDGTVAMMLWGVPNKPQDKTLLDLFEDILTSASPSDHTDQLAFDRLKQAIPSNAEEYKSFVNLIYSTYNNIIRLVNAENTRDLQESIDETYGTSHYKLKEDDYYQEQEYQRPTYNEPVKEEEPEFHQEVKEEQQREHREQVEQKPQFEFEYEDEPVPLPTKTPSVDDFEELGTPKKKGMYKGRRRHSEEDVEEVEEQPKKPKGKPLFEMMDDNFVEVDDSDKTTVNIDSFDGDSDKTEILSGEDMEDEEEFFALIRKDTSEQYHIEEGSNVIGRANSCDIEVKNNKSISSKHCTIFLEDGQFYLKDTNSANGTYLNGKKLGKNEKIPITLDDEIMLSDEVFQIVQE